MIVFLLYFSVLFFVCGAEGWGVCVGVGWGGSGEVEVCGGGSPIKLFCLHRHLNCIIYKY